MRETPDSWRGFFATLVGTAAGVSAVIWLFVVLVNPFGTLPVSFPFDRWQVDGNARYAFPAFARSARFDSANFGTSTSRLLRPAVLDAAFGARFVNLAMNSASAFEQTALMDVFMRAHPAPKVITVGIDVGWCVTKGGLVKFSLWRFPEWLYREGRWRDYRYLFDLYSVEKAGQAFAEFAGLKPEVYGRDGYTSFVPEESAYDAARALGHIHEMGVQVPPGERTGDPAGWDFVALEMLQERLAALPAQTRKVLYFVPYNHVLIAPPGSAAAEVWGECRRRVTAMAEAIPNATAVDFMIPGAITDDDTKYWDALHYRQPVADRIARDLAAASRGEAGEDYRLLRAVSDQ